MLCFSCNRDSKGTGGQDININMRELKNLHIIQLEKTKTIQCTYVNIKNKGS